MSAGIPTTMRAAVLDGAGPPDAFHLRTVEVPRLTRNHVLIALDYASVGTWDAQARSGAWGTVSPGKILGVDGSGTVATLAADVTGLRVGDRVYAYSYDNPHGGFYAEYASVSAERVWHVPRQLDQKVAGAIPCVALTAQACLDALHLRSGRTLLVYGGSGGVGSLAVWLAAGARGENVVATGRPDAHDYLRRLGAAHAIDPHPSSGVPAIARVAPSGFDAALVTSGGETLAAFLAHLRDGVPFAFPNGVEPAPHADGHRALGADGPMSRPAFEELNRAIGTRTIPLHVESFALADVAAAHRRIEQGHVLGKIVLQIHS
ncbi:MAG TPA: NADP-dependent oxidoreductase [Candidatus Sulfotelmatobacter sp.]|nr:NADP-dependent oxidoreductase [Candidatus Sulfotelmatobacter sp.]